MLMIWISIMLFAVYNLACDHYFLAAYDIDFDYAFFHVDDMDFDYAFCCL